ncbi:MAG: hypothetical protein U0T80_01490 [Flavobacteriaceae bacterium]
MMLASGVDSRSIYQTRYNRVIFPYSLCDEDQSSIGYETFDLEGKVDYILLGQTGMSVTFY